MANKLYEESDIQAAADAIREKNGLTDTYKVSEFAGAIRSISSGISSGARVYTTEVTLDEQSSEIPVTHNLGSTDILLAAAYLAEDCVEKLVYKDNIANVYILTQFAGKTSNNGTLKENIRLSSYWYASSDGESSYMMSSVSTGNVPTITDENNITIKSYTGSYMYPAGLKIGIIVVAI
ncbi:MAG: hypothetical protein ACI3XQ_11515 [Eubacteriales bacterium]